MMLSRRSSQLAHPSTWQLGQVTTCLPRARRSHMRPIVEERREIRAQRARAGANLCGICSCGGQGGMTPLLNACERGDAAIVKVLMTASSPSCDVNLSLAVRMHMCLTAMIVVCDAATAFVLRFWSGWYDCVALCGTRVTRLDREDSAWGSSEHELRTSRRHYSAVLRL